MHIIPRFLVCALCVLLDLFVLVVYGVIKVVGAPLPKSVHRASHPTLVLLHGSGADEHQFHVATRLYAGWANTITLDLTGDKTIEQYAFDLALQIDHLRDVYLVGVSMGGLIAAQYAYVLQRQNVRGVVTIGTPWRGSPALRGLGWMFRTKRHAQMHPESEFLVTLHSYLHPRMPLLTVGSYADLHVPNEYSQPPISHLRHTHHALVAPGHIALTVTPTIFRAIRKWITNNA